MLTSLKQRTKREVFWQMRSQLPALSPFLMQFAQFWPHAHEAGTFALPAYSGPQPSDGFSSRPVPPPELRAGYGTSTKGYLASGREDIDALRSILSAQGIALEQAERILDMGCAAGRLTRWLIDAAPNAEIWGTDIWSSAIYWCQEHLRPANFAVTTTVPHLPFEDRHFDLIVCGSVFTHIDDLATAWLLELRRLLKPGGHLYVTINDRTAIKRFQGEGDPAEFPRFYERAGGQPKWNRFVQALDATPEYHAFRRGERDMVSIGRSIESHVLWDADVFCARVAPWLRCTAVVPEGYGHQTVIVFQRP